MERRFRIALSFAGTEREFVSEVADRLADAFGREKILYDRFHRAEFSRSDLALYLPTLYHEQADLLVVVLSPSYETKEWCGLEWHAAFGLIKKRHAKSVMLMRFGHAEAEAAFGLAGYVDLDGMQSHEAADLILERLALNDGYSPDHFRRASRETSGLANQTSDDWPSSPPQLDWRVADHTAAREAFTLLLTRDPPFQLLPIFGPSGTGKTLLSNQFLRNALTKLPFLRCARLDFKGSAGLSGQVQQWAEHLGVTPPIATASLLEQVKAVVSELRRLPQSTLLIFDTFEASADVEHWFSESLLISALRWKWLRLVVLGQSVPQPDEKAWTTLSCRPVALTVPTAADWHAFVQDQLHLNEVDASFVERAHRLVNGHPGRLASLFAGATVA